MIRSQMPYELAQSQYNNVKQIHCTVYEILFTCWEIELVGLQALPVHRILEVEQLNCFGI